MICIGLGAISLIVCVIVKFIPEDKINCPRMGAKEKDPN